MLRRLMPTASAISAIVVSANPRFSNKSQAAEIIASVVTFGFLPADVCSMGILSSLTALVIIVTIDALVQKYAKVYLIGNSATKTR